MPSERREAPVLQVDLLERFAILLVMLHVVFDRNGIPRIPSGVDSGSVGRAFELFHDLYDTSKARI